MSLFLTDYPVPLAKTEEILDLIKRGENVSTLWMPHSGRTDFAIQLQAKSGLVKKDWENTDFFVLDVSLDSPFLEKRFEELKIAIKEIVEQGKRAVLTLDSFSLNKAAFIKYVFSLRHELPPRAINYLILAFESEFFEKRTKRTDMSLIYNNILKIPYYTREETYDWLTYETYNYSQLKNLSDNDKEAFYEFCGGVFGLLINMSRSYRLTGSVEKAKNTVQMKNTLQHIWGRFSERERLILKCLATHQHLPPYTFELSYMKEHLLVTPDNKLTGHWPEMLTGSEISPIELEMEKDAVIWNGVNLLDLFTSTEQGVMLELLKKKELTREELAKLLWGAKAQEKYSDWAIDQTISRMRKKLVMAGISEEKLKTVKGKGVKLEGVNIR